jgi:hypothetical protein
MPRLPDDLPLRKEELERIDREYGRMVKASRSACEDRDRQFVDLRKLRAGEPENDYVGPWKGSSRTVDTLAAEMHQQIHASLRTMIRYKYFTFAPAQSMPNMKAGDVMRVENWYNARLKSDGWESAISDVLFMACEQLAGIIYVGWTQEEQHGHSRMWIETGTDNVYYEEPDDLIRKPKKYRMVDRPRTPDVIRTGLDLRSVNPWSIHTWPVNAMGLSPRYAHCVFEDMWLSDSELADGVDELHYDEENVDWLLHNQEEVPSEDSPEVEAMIARLDQEGIEPTRGGVRRCVVVTGRLPVTDHAGDRIVDAKRGISYVDFEWTMCGSRVLRRVLSPHPVRPYAPVRVLRIPNSLWGDGVVSLTRWLQKEATALRRGAHDLIDLAVNAPFIGPDHLERLGGVKLKPGGYLARQQGTVLEQLVVNVQAAEVALAEAGQLYGKGASITSAQNVGSMSSGKVRKAAEVEFTSSVVKQKAELMAANVASDLEEVSQLCLAQYAAHGNVLQDAILPGGKSAAVQAEELRQHYRIVPTMRTDMLNEDTRLKRTMEMREALMNSPLMQMRVQHGDVSGIYELDGRLAEEFGEQDREQLLGPEPPAPQQAEPTTPDQQGGSPQGMPGAAGMPIAPQESASSNNGAMIMG